MYSVRSGETRDPEEPSLPTIIRILIPIKLAMVADSMAYNSPFQSFSFRKMVFPIDNIRPQFDGKRHAIRQEKEGAHTAL
jgi:hypothetical protein